MGTTIVDRQILRVDRRVLLMDKGMNRRVIRVKKTSTTSGETSTTSG